MRQIIRHLRECGLLVSPDANEYSELVHSVDTLISEKESVSKQMNDYQISLQNSLLDRLFSSTALRHDAEETLLMQMERFPERSLIYCGRVFISSADTNTSLEMTVVMLLEFLKKRLPNNAILHSTDTMTFGLVYPCLDDAETAEGNLKQIIDAVQQRFSARIILVRGGLCDGISQIGACFERAQMSYVPYSGRNEQGSQLILPSEAEDSQNQSLRFRALQALYQFMASGNADKAVEEMRCFYTDVSDASQINMRERYSALRVHILLSCREIQEDFPCPEIPHYRPERSPRQQMDMLEAAIREVCTRVRERQADVQDDRLNTFTDYLNQHFSDPELCAASLATEFHVSEKYLFGLFKKKTGYSPTSYLHHIRMSEASRRLEECDDTVQDISASVGFANFGTFYKAFKREYGVAPGKYREQHQSRG